MISSSDILKARILIVDDQEPNVILLEEMLRDAGYLAVTSTMDPCEVCELHRQNSYSIILLDLLMPGMDGFEVMEGLKIIEAGGYLPVLVQTAQPAHKLRALKAGARDFISKPFDLAEVLLRVRNIIEVRLLHSEATLRTEQAEASLRALHDSELSYRRLFETAQDGVLILEAATGRITDVNPYLVGLLGFSHDEMVGQTVGELSPFKDIESNKIMLDRLQKDGYVRYDDLPLEKRDGSKLAVEFVSNVYQAGDQKVIQCNIRDITARKRTEEQLKASFKEVFDLKAALDEHALVAITDPEGKITYVNDKFCAISKYSREELMGQDHRIVNSGYHPQSFMRDLWMTIGLGKVWKGEIKNKAKDGLIYWVNTTIVPFLDEDGKPRQYVAIRADITESKLSEEARLISEARYRTLFECAPDGIVIADSESYYLDANASICQMLGYTRDELIGLHASDIVAPPELEHIGPALSVIRTELDYHREWTFRRKDGSLFSADVIATMMPDGNLMGMIRDITERKQVEIQIRQLNADLELRVSQRTSELEAANKELEAFSYSVSHDLRAPLRAIDGFSQAVIEDFGPQLPDEGRQYLRTIREGAQRMANLIDDLLTFSRLSRVPLAKNEVNIDALVRSVLNDLNSQQKGRQIDLRIGELPPCEGDLSLLRQVWINLLSNALKYTRLREAVVIEIGCSQEESENVYFVRDNGAGFDMRYADKLFGVFQRLHRAEDYEGTGVGLAIVQRIIHRHGGRIWAIAAVDRGSTFSFTLEGKSKL